MLRRLVAEAMEGLPRALASALVLPQVNSPPEIAKAAFDSLLRVATRSPAPGASLPRMLLLLDGFDKLLAAGHAADLTWLPQVVADIHMRKLTLTRLQLQISTHMQI